MLERSLNLGVKGLGAPTRCIWAGIRKHDRPPAGDTTGNHRQSAGIAGAHTCGGRRCCETTSASAGARVACDGRTREPQGLHGVHGHGADAGETAGVCRARAGAYGAEWAARKSAAVAGRANGASGATGCWHGKPWLTAGAGADRSFIAAEGAAHAETAKPKIPFDTAM